MPARHAGSVFSLGYTRHTNACVRTGPARFPMMTSSPDPWRDTPLRFAGYANEVGEAFRPLVNHRWVMGSYACSMAYVVGDTYHKTVIARERALSRGAHPLADMCTTAVDVLAWQSLASVAIPGLAINRIVALSRHALLRAGRTPGLAPTAIGLASIPLIIKPIDQATDAAFDSFLRPSLHSSAVQNRILGFGLTVARES